MEPNLQLYRNIEVDILWLLMVQGPSQGDRAAASFDYIAASYCMEERRIPSETREFWGKVWVGMQRLFAFVLFVPAHWLVGQMLRWVFPAPMAVILNFMEIVVSLFFALIYVYLAWEMLAAFFPFLKKSIHANVNRPSEEKGD
jgi:hypothetical protein